jgi:hypothetical protein
MPGQDSNAGLPDMTIEWLCALEPGFQCYAAKGGKRTKFTFFALVFSLHSRARFLARGSAKREKSVIIKGFGFLLYELIT